MGDRQTGGFVDWEMGKAANCSAEERAGRAPAPWANNSEKRLPWGNNGDEEAEGGSMAAKEGRKPMKVPNTL